MMQKHHILFPTQSPYFRSVTTLFCSDTSIDTRKYMDFKLFMIIDFIVRGYKPVSSPVNIQTSYDYFCQKRIESIIGEESNEECIDPVFI